MGRCYPQWTELAKCSKSVAHPDFCVLFREDYMECLHRKKMKRRIGQVMQAEEEAKHPKPVVADGHGHH